MFQIRTIKLQSIKVINKSHLTYDVRVFFLTIDSICEELKINILNCPNVDNIQCKQQKRNQSL